MNKFSLDGVLVVEGKSDQAKISTFLSSPIITTNGLDVNDKLLSFLLRVSETTNLYLFLDDDDAGKQIQEKIVKYVENPTILTYKPNNYTSRTKHGNAEIPYEELYKFFSSLKVDNKNNFDQINPGDIAIKELKHQGYKNELIKKHDLLNGNNKFIALQMSILGLKL